MRYAQKWRAMWPAILLFGMVGRATAQVRGTVVDSAGHPLADAVVDLWTPTARVGRVVTGASGQFSFPTTPGARRLAVRRVGSAPSRVDLDHGDSAVVVTLAQAPVMLEAIRVDGGCTNKEDRTAVAMWRRAAMMYRLLPDSLWISAALKFSAERLPREEVGRPSTDSTGYGWTGGSLITTNESELEAEVRKFGWPAPDPETFASNGRIWGATVQYLVTPAFLREERFTQVDESTIRFCPRSRHLPWAEGEIKFADDGSLLWARWRYETPRYDPTTGHLVIFIAPAPDSSLPLLPSTDLLWQERTSGISAQRTIDFREWRISATEPLDERRRR